MGKTCRVTKSTLHYKKRRGFCRKKLEDVVNTWNEGDVVNSSVNIEFPLVNNIVNNIVNIVMYLVRQTCRLSWIVRQFTRERSNLLLSQVHHLHVNQ